MSTIARGRGQRGMALVLAALMCLIILPMMGLAVDGAIAYLMRAKLSRAVDAAVLAGARSLSRGLNVDSQRSNAIAVSERYFDANLPAGDWGSKNLSRMVAVGQDDATRVRWVTITASLDVPTIFMAALKHDTVHISMSGEARRRDVNVMLVLDRSSSMSSGNAIAPMRIAAKSFVDKFAGGRDKVGLVVFGGSYLVAYPPSTDFKTGSPNMPDLIDGIVAGGNTGTAQALWQAYQQLAMLNEQGTLNVIVLFTDGLPNGLTADYNLVLKATSGCVDNVHPKIGFIAQWGGNRDPGTTAGVIDPFAISVGNIGESQPAQNSGGCAYASDFTNMRNAINRMPDQDLYGNSTTGYKPVDLTRVDLPTQISAASTNAADDAARRIRRDATLRPYIYVVGLGGTSAEPPDYDFMQRVANDPSSASFTQSEPSGLFVWSPTSSQLQSAFLHIASEILRLSQ